MLSTIIVFLGILVLAYPLGVVTLSLETVPIDFYWDKGPEELL